MYQFNKDTFEGIRSGELYQGQSVAEVDRQLVRREQSIVQRNLDSLSAGDRNTVVSNINRTLNGIAEGLFAGATDPVYAGILRDVREDLGRDIDFGNYDDRVAIGDAITASIRERRNQ